MAGCLDVVLIALPLQVDLLKTKVKLLEITQLLTEGVVGGQKFAPKIRQSSHINKNELIKKALMQKLKDSETQSEPKLCGEENENTNSMSEVGSTGASTSYPKSEQRQGDLLGSSYDISHIKECDVFSGKVRLTEQQVKSFVEHRKSWPLFEEVFMVSAKKGTGVDDLRDFLIACAQPHPWIFSPQV